LSLRSAQARKQTFLQSLAAVGLKPDLRWMIEGDHTLDGGRDAMQRLLALRTLPTAIMCSNDMTAIGVQHSLFGANLKVPQDFSLIGFDDIHLAAYTIPPLTTVRMSCTDLAERTVSSLCLHLQTEESSGRTIDKKIPTRLVVRQTTGVPRDKLSLPKPNKSRTQSGL
jgi:LacI family transcriptional regulator